MLFRIKILKFKGLRGSVTCLLKIRFRLRSGSTENCLAFEWALEYVVFLTLDFSEKAFPRLLFLEY